MDWTHWMDIIPVIPLEGWVPITHLDDEEAREDDCFFCWADSGRMHTVYKVGSIDPTGWRVNLDDPLGFAYALRVYARAVKARGDLPPAVVRDVLEGCVPPMLKKWALGTITDDDKLDLAKALRSVVFPVPE